MKQLFTYQLHKKLE